MSGDNIFNIALKAINEGDYELFVIIISGFFFVWSYNEFRKNYISVKSQNKLDIEKSLEQYSKLYFGIKTFQLENITLIELYDYFNQAMVYLPRSIVKEILKLDKNKLEINSQYLENIKNLVESEILSIKYKQNTITTFDDRDNIFERTSWALSNNNFDSFIWPFVYSFFALTGVFFLVTVGAVIKDLPGFIKISFIIFLSNTLFSIMTLMHLVDLALDKKLKINICKYFLLLIILPFCLTTFLLDIKYSIVNTITIILFIANSKKLLHPYNKENI